MKRPVIVSTMALLAVLGVAQVPMFWEYPAPLTPAYPPKTASVPLAPSHSPPINFALAPQAAPSAVEGKTITSSASLATAAAVVASPLPPPPRNSDVPAARQTPPDAPIAAPLQPNVALSPVPVRQPSGDRARRGQGLPGPTVTRPRQQPTQLLNQTRATTVSATQKPQHTRLAQRPLPALAYAYAPPPRLQPSPRRQPALRYR